jgi:hypothetical protein
MLSYASMSILPIEEGYVRFEVFLHSVLQLLVTANVFPSSPILVTPMMEGICSSEMSVLTRATWHNIPEERILLIITLCEQCFKSLCYSLCNNWEIIFWGVFI